MKELIVGGEHGVARIADADDAADLAALGERTFRAAFAATNDPIEMERYVAAAFRLEQVQSEMADEANTFLVLDSADGLVGYSKLREGKVPDCVTNRQPVELERIYVETQAIGTGLGAVLMEATLAYAQAAGFWTMWLGVWEENTRAIEFYKKWGFETVGEHVFQFGSEAQSDIVMERQIGD